MTTGWFSFYAGFSLLPLLIYDPYPVGDSSNGPHRRVDAAGLAAASPSAVESLEELRPGAVDAVSLEEERATRRTGVLRRPSLCEGIWTFCFVLYVSCGLRFGVHWGWTVSIVGWNVFIPSNFVATFKNAQAMFLELSDFTTHIPCGRDQPNA